MRRLPVKRLDADVRIPTELYFIECQCAERHIKIGVSSNIKVRLVNMRAHCPYDLRLLKAVVAGAHLEIELHQRFAADRVRGEWFRRTPELLAYIDSLPSNEPAPTGAADLIIEPWPMTEKRLLASMLGE
jgi:hypothetical protein